MSSQGFRGVLSQRKRVLATVLRVSRFDGHSRFIAIKIEARAAQAAKLPRAQPGFHGQTVEQGALGRWHSEAVNGRDVTHLPVRARDVIALLGRFKDAAHVVDGQRLPVVSPVCLNVETLQVMQGRFRSAAVANHPPAELLDGLQVEVERLRRDSPDRPLAFHPIVPHVGQNNLHLAR